MKSSLALALLVDATQSCDRLNYLLDLASSLQQLGHRPHVFALVVVGAPLSWLDSTSPVPIYPVVSHPCPFGPDDLIRQRIQEFVDHLEHRPQSYDIYHAQDMISASALTLMQGLGFIDQFLYTVHEPDLANETYLTPEFRTYHHRAVRAAEYCLCFSDDQQQFLEDQFSAHTLRLATPPLSRVQRRRRRDALSQGRTSRPPSDPRADLHQVAVEQHLTLYEALSEALHQHSHTYAGSRGSWALHYQ
ncbi:MAG: glycosyltransferase [Synechococcales cyanobacterium CRU_2_2]|nr:glycosyltransferase [Synechococcales cyanobacterium CRU_2_2]